MPTSSPSPPPSALRRLSPYLCGIAGVGVTYPVAQVAIGKPMLSASIAVFIFVAGYMACRLVQLRGRLTVAMAVFGLPLVTALSFFGIERYTELSQRQATFDALADAGIKFRARMPDRTGEWTQDESGNFVPVWFADRIGADCLRELASIEGTLEDLQRHEYREIDSSDLRFVTMDWAESDTQVTNGFLAWLESLRLDGLMIKLRLSGEGSQRAVAQAVQMVRDISSTRSNSHTYIDVEGRRGLPRDVAASLTQLSPETTLTLRGVTIGKRELKMLADQGFASIVLDGVQLPVRLGGVSESISGNRMSDLRVVTGRMLSPNFMNDLARVFRCRSLACETTARDEEIVWSGTVLESVYVWDGETRRSVMRPSNVGH